MKKIYLAAPYSHEDDSVVSARVDKINQKAAELMDCGHIVFSPISHSHYIAAHTKADKLNHDFWLSRDLPFIDFCDEIWIYCLPGWDRSRGVATEIGYAKALNKPVIYFSEDI